MENKPTVEQALQVSIIVLVHNGLHHIQNLMKTRHLTGGVHVEWILVNNGSDEPTSEYLATLADVHLVTSKTNRLFAGGNNLGALCATGKYLLLMNSDVLIHNSRWLVKMLTVHKRGMTGLGYIGNPPRCDGFCVLIDRDLYGEGLEPAFAWWWCITRLQARLLHEGHSVQAVVSFKEIEHIGKGSGETPKDAAGMNTSREIANSWFNGLPPLTIIKRLPE